MSDKAARFIQHLSSLQEADRAAMACLRRSLAFEPGTYAPAFPYVERFAGSDAAWRTALYLTAGLFALNPLDRRDLSFAGALGEAARQRGRAGVEARFIRMLRARDNELRLLLRYAMTMLAREGLGLDYQGLLKDLAILLHPRCRKDATKVRRKWAGEFYRAYQ